MTYTFENTNTAMFDTTSNENMSKSTENAELIHTTARKNRQTASMRNKILSAIFGASLMLGAFSFMPQMGAKTAPLSSPSPTSTNSSAVTHTQTIDSGISAMKDGTVVSVAPVAASYQGVARQAAIRNGINPDLFVRQIQQESGFNPNAVSSAGARGIAQFMPATAAAMGVNTSDPVSSLNGAARLMGDLNRQFGGNYGKALAAYNAGPGAVQGAVARGGGNWLAQLPGETQHYVRHIMG